MVYMPSLEYSKMIWTNTVTSDKQRTQVKGSTHFRFGQEWGPHQHYWHWCKTWIDSYGGHAAVVLELTRFRVGVIENCPKPINLYSDNMQICLFIVTPLNSQRAVLSIASSLFHIDQKQ